MRHQVRSSLCLAVRLTLVICFTFLIYCLLSAALDEIDDDVAHHSVLSSRTGIHAVPRSNAIDGSATAATGQRRSVDNESALTSAAVADVNSTDRYNHYSAPLSRRSDRHPKDALGEIKFLRQSVEATRWPRLPRGGAGQVPSSIAVKAVGGRGGGSSLTSLSRRLSDNQRLPARSVNRRRRRPQSASSDTQPYRDDATDERLQEMWLTTVTSRELQPVTNEIQTETDAETGREVMEMELERTTLKLTSSDCRLSDGAHCQHTSTHQQLNTVPHVLHQTSDDVTVSTQVGDWMRSWSVHNPAFDTWFWTDSAVRRLLDAYFPPWLVKLYDSYPLAINRADLRKYVVLYAVGGIVADLDVECLRPVTPLLDWLKASQRSCVVAQEPPLHREFLYSTTGSAQTTYVTPAIIICRPHHPFVRFVLSLLPRYAANADKLRWNENVLNSTGPTFLSDAVRLYQTTHGVKHGTTHSRSASRHLLVAPSRWFLPTFDPLHAARFQTLCLLRGATSSRRRPAGCDDVPRNRPHSDSYTTHHWLHSWADGFVHGPLVNVTRLTRITRLIS